MFEAAERETKIVLPVTLLHLRFFKGPPLRQTAEPLGRALLTDVSSPHCDFIKRWSREQRRFYGTLPVESAIAELFVFENATAAKKLEIYAWSVEQVRYGQASFHNSFLLQVVDM
ncbi:hypothetical protein AAVH_08732 [Aphelenchoides avenae]|nr:hypothetical protein AAVH_08732 [Aphelenchus avenae]